MMRTSINTPHYTAILRLGHIGVIIGGYSGRGVIRGWPGSGTVTGGPGADET